MLQGLAKTIGNWAASVADTGAPAYNAATSGRRLFHWKAAGGDVNANLAGNLDTLRARSRDMVRQNAFANNAVSSFVSNCVGTGIIPRSKHPDPAIREKVQRAWTAWTDEADAIGATDFYGLQSLVCRSTMEAGECLVRMRPRYLQDGLTVPLQLQIIESEHLPLWKTDVAAGGNPVKCGIEFDAIGRKAAYHLYREHPGAINPSPQGLELVRVPAASICHTYQPLRPGQFRGEPWMTSVLVQLHELERYDDATRVRNRMAAMFVAFMYENEGRPIAEQIGTDVDDTPMSVLEPGTTWRLHGDERVQLTDPPNVGATYGEFMRVQLRAIAAGIGITYEQLTGDLTGVNYSSIRAGLLEFRRRCEQFQHQVLIFQLCRPIWRAWMDAAALAGVIDARDYKRNPSDYLSVSWRPPRWEWVDPEKDVSAAIKLVRAGFGSRAEVIGQRGEEPEEVDREIADDNARADALGLILDSDPRKTGGNGQQPTPEPTQEGAPAQ